MTHDRKAVQYKISRYISVTVFLLIGFLIAGQIEWQGNKTLHTIMEVLATTLALMVGILALIRFYTKKNNVFLLIGAGFLGTAFLDGYHAVVTSAFFDAYFPSPLPSLSPWSWLASRMFLSVLMALSWWTSRRSQSGSTEAQGHISERFVFIAVGAATLFSFLFFAFYPLPRAYYPELFFGRPEEFVPAAFFLLALGGYLKREHWKEDSFEDWVVISLIVGLMGQVMFMSFSVRLFDTMFDIAHMLKKVSYLCMMQGLFVAMFQGFQQAEESKANLSEVLKQVEASNKEFESVIEFSPNGIILTDQDRKIVLVNSMIETTFGYQRSELIGKQVEALIPLRYRNQHSEHVAHYHDKPIPAMGASRAGNNLLGMRKDGTEFPVEIGLSPFQTEKGTRVLAVVNDISERRAAEEKLEAERKALKKANLELDSFVYTASHDLRAPLRGIASFSRFLEEDYADRLDDEGRDHLRRIRKGVGRMVQLIDDLLSLSRISRQDHPYEAVQVDTMIRSVMERLEFDLEASRVKLVIPEHLPVISCDRIKVSEVFLNLINNAIKFSQKNNNGGPGRAGVPVSEGGPKVEVGFQEQNDDYHFSVKDNGIGIDPKYHERIFGIFQRLHTRGEYEGTGAGLSIVKRVIDDHKGRIWIDSKLGEGATFHFTIPKKIEEG